MLGYIGQMIGSCLIVRHAVVDSNTTVTDENPFLLLKWKKHLVVTCCGRHNSVTLPVVVFMRFRFACRETLTQLVLCCRLACALL